MRRPLAALALLFALAFATLAHAGTYLDTAALLLGESRKTAEWVQSHLTDTKLAAIAHDVAEARVKAGRLVVVPKDVEKAHPHLLLALETTERALAAAADGDPSRFMRLVLQAREEERTYRAILGQQKLALPELEHRN